MNTNIAIAIDGPAAAGKSTVAKTIAQKLAYIYIDTGAMYRSLTYLAIKQNTELEDEEQLEKLLKQTKIDFLQSDNGNEQRVIVNGEDVTLNIRSKEVSNHVSIVAKHSKIRQIMVNRQQALAYKRNVVMDGRDIGTHVLPDATYKFFLVASVEERANRRHEENIKKGFESDLNELKIEIEKRDKHDTERKIAPLIKANDAIEVDTTSMSIQEVVEFLLNTIKKRNT